jgi:hypothetical protein
MKKMNKYQTLEHHQKNLQLNYEKKIKQYNKLRNFADELQTRIQDMKSDYFKDILNKESKIIQLKKEIQDITIQFHKEKEEDNLIIPSGLQSIEAKERKFNLKQDQTLKNFEKFKQQNEEKLMAKIRELKDNNRNESFQLLNIKQKEIIDLQQQIADLKNSNEGKTQSNEILIS